MRSFLFVLLFSMGCLSFAESPLPIFHPNISSAPPIRSFQTSALTPNRYGNIPFSLPAKDFLAATDNWHLRAEVSFLSPSNTTLNTISLPVVFSIAELNIGEDVLLCPSDASRPPTALRYYGSFAEAHHIALRSPSNTWTSTTDSFPICAKIRLLPILPTPNSATLPSENSFFYSTNRSDYTTLSNEDFANFRIISPQSVLPGIAYRASSPINPKYGRADTVDALCKSNGIRTIWNLADSPCEASAYPNYSNRYVSTCITLHTPIGVDLLAPSFRSALSNGIAFLQTNPPPYLIHCNEGKDRTALIAAFLELRSGATPQEIINDYCKTFQNYYSYFPASTTNNILQLISILRYLP